MSTDTVTVHILDKVYQVACPPEQKQALTDAANHLDEQMRTIRGGGKVIGLERIAVMAALNIAYELLQQSSQSSQGSESTKESLVRLNSKLDEALHSYSQLQIG